MITLLFHCRRSLYISEEDAHHCSYKSASLLSACVPQVWSKALKCLFCLVFSINLFHSSVQGLFSAVLGKHRTFYGNLQFRLQRPICDHLFRKANELSLLQKAESDLILSGFQAPVGMVSTLKPP